MNNKKKINKKDLTKVLIRSHFIQGSWNFERMQSLGFCFALVPIIKKLYHNNLKEQRLAIKRHLEFFNTHPYMAAPILGIIIAMEEKRANGFKITDNNINNIKVGLMGPLAGVGDPIFWGTLRPILSALGSSLAATGNIMGPIIFFVFFNAVRLSTLYYGINYGYKKGLNIIKELNQNLIKKITEASSILGLFVMGSLVNKWTRISIPIIVTANKRNSNITNIVTVQNILDQILPGLVPLLLTLTCMWLLKKKINPLMIIVYLFILSIIGSYFKLIYY